MAKVTAPLLSLGARGQIGKGIVMAGWRGIKTARAYTVPANPRTVAQQANRTRFAFLREMYKMAPAAVQAPWIEFCKGRPFLPFNKFVGENNRLLNGEVDLANMIVSPGAGGGLPPAGIVAVAGGASGEVDITVTPPADLPVGWLVTECGAAAVHDVNPVSLFDGVFRAGVDAATPYEITLDSLGSAENCVAFGWVVYTKPNGDFAYSVSLADQVVSAA